MDLVEMFLVDTCDTCILCQNDCDIHYRPGDARQMTSSSKFTMLLLHLKVNLRKMLEFSSILTRHDVHGEEGGVNLLVSLCSRCTSATAQFLERFQELENIRLQLDKCHEELHDLIQGGRRMSAETGEVKGVDDRNWRLAKILREETLDKCSIHLHSSTSEIDLRRKQSTGSLPRRHLKASTDTCAVASENITNPLTEEVKLESFSMSGPTPAEMSPTTSEQSLSDYEQPGNLSDSETEGGGGEYDPLASSDEGKPKGHNLRSSTRKNKISRTSSSADEERSLSSSRDNITGSPASKTKILSQNSDHECPHCGKVLSRAYDVRRHIRNVHPTETPNVKTRPYNKNPGKLLCSQCGKVFGRRSHLVRHIQNVHAQGKDSPKVSENSGKFECSHCGIRLCKRHNLDRHIQTVRLKVQITCDHCPRSFTRKESLKHHLMLKHPLEKFSNEFSWKPTKKQFFTALGTVTEGRETTMTTIDNVDGVIHKCHQCERSFFDVSTLKLHMLQFHFDQVLSQLDVEKGERIRNGEDVELEESDSTG